MTNTLADRDDVIGDLITNLNHDARRPSATATTSCRDLIIQLRTFVGGLKSDREAILGSLD